MKQFIFVLVLSIIVFSCNKEIITDPGPVTLININVTEKSPNSLTLSYTLSNNQFSETGVFYGTDSLVLVDNIGVKIAKGILSDKLTYKSIVFSELSNKPIWVQVYIKDKDNKIVRYKIEKLYPNSNFRFGPTFNGSVSQEFEKYSELEILADKIDTNELKYRALIGTTTCYITSVKAISEDKITYKLIIRIPSSQNEGVNSLNLFYDNNKVFEGKIDIDKSNIIKVKKLTTHFLNETRGAYFYVNNKIYIGSTTLCNWDILTNTWSKVGSLPVDQYGYATIIPGDVGIEFSGKVWFPLLSGYVDNFNKGIITYVFDVTKNNWSKIVLKQFTPSAYGSEFVKCYTSFRWNDKLYFVLNHSFNSGYPAYNWSRVYLAEVDPVNNSFNEVMDLDPVTGNYDAAVFNNKIYFHASDRKIQFSGNPIDKRSRMFELDLNNKKLLEKAPLLVNGKELGLVKPSIFSYKNHLFLYGSEGDNFESNELMEYIPSTDKWKQYFLDVTEKIPGAKKLCYVYQDKVYVGMGLARLPLGCSDIFEFEFPNVIK